MLRQAGRSVLAALAVDAGRLVPLEVQLIRIHPTTSS
jgi:hypothetical protein